MIRHWKRQILIALVDIRESLWRLEKHRNEQDDETKEFR